MKAILTTLAIITIMSLGATTRGKEGPKRADGLINMFVVDDASPTADVLDRFYFVDVANISFTGRPDNECKIVYYEASAASASFHLDATQTRSFSFVDFSNIINDTPFSVVFIGMAFFPVSSNRTE